MKAIERLKQYIDYKGFTNSSFEKKNELSNGYIATQLKRNADLGEGVLIKILDNCLDLNPLWLLTGKGSMLKEDLKSIISQNIKGNSNIQSAGNDNTITNDNNKIIKELQKKIIEKDKEIERQKKQIDKLFNMLP